MLFRIDRQGVFGSFALQAMAPQPIVVTNDCLPVVVDQTGAAGAYRRLGQACDDPSKWQLPLGDLLVRFVDTALLVVRASRQRHRL